MWCQKSITSTPSIRCSCSGHARPEDDQDARTDLRDARGQGPVAGQRRAAHRAGKCRRALAACSADRPLEFGAAPKHGLPEDGWAFLKNKLHAEGTNLVSCTWRFRPDPRNEGLARGWHQPTLASEEGWKDIRIGTAWESQGHPGLDGWAWYRLEIDVPARWQGRDVFLSFEGVDDIYELYVNGEPAGQGVTSPHAKTRSTRRRATTSRAGATRHARAHRGAGARLVWGRRHLPPGHAGHHRIQPGNGVAEVARGRSQLALRVEPSREPPSARGGRSGYMSPFPSTGIR